MFEHDPYVSLRTFRRTGVPVDTPVWCAHIDQNLYVFSAADAGKVKRLRNSDASQVAKCDARGRILGDWHEATAVLVEDPDEIEAVLKAFRAKYGWQMLLADWGAKLTGRFAKRAYIKVTF